MIEIFLTGSILGGVIGSVVGYYAGKLSSAWNMARVSWNGGQND